MPRLRAGQRRGGAPALSPQRAGANRAMDQTQARPSPAPPAPAAPNEGLTEAEAEARLSADGPNELPSQARFNWTERLLGPFREPAYQLLVAAGAVYLALGDRLEGALLFAAAVLAVGIAIVQDYRTERTLIRLRDLASPRALVRRGGATRRIPARELVTGDIVLLEDGDRAPADGVLLAATGLAADESLMTGESAPVDKAAAPAPDAESEPDPLGFVLGGSVIVRGEGVMRVTATGPRSRLGQIGVAIAGSPFEPPRLTVHLRRLVRLFAVAAVGASLLLFAGQGLATGEWMGALLLSLALAISLVPEEIPLVIAVFTVIGALRIARAGVLARQAAAIETLGETTVLCLDKTGTLTRNRMEVSAVWTPADGLAPADGPGGDGGGALRAAAAACSPNPRDPMELAILRAAPQAGDGQCIVQSWPFERALMAMANLCRADDGGETLFLKGAPEAVIPWAETAPGRRAEAERAAADMAARGMRVIAVAEGLPPQGSLRDAPLRLTGLVGLADPLRPEAPELIAQCAAAGIRVMMMTGDHPATAMAIAREAGIADGGAVVDGPALAAMNEGQRTEACARAAVFARVVPEQKLIIVNALREAGEIVAMTGDGVNDAPALKAAHIGVAMGDRGSDVAREAAALVLVHDDLASLVKAFRLGRRISDNVRKALAYIFSIHVMIAGTALAPLLFGMPPILLPLHVVILEFAIDPVCAIVLEADKPQRGVMRRPPRRPDQPLFGVRDIAVNLTLGLVALAGVLAAYVWTMRTGDADTARATAFLTIMALNAALILVTRAQGGRLGAILRTHNPLLWPAVVLIFGAGVLATHLGPVAAVLDFAPPRIAVSAACAAAALALALSLEAASRLLFRARRRAA